MIRKSVLQGASWTVMVIVLGLAAPLAAQQNMPNPKEISGVPLPASDLPPGTLSVLVVRGNFDKPLPDRAVEFTIDGATQSRKTDAAGRVLLNGLKTGAHVQASTAIDGERLVSQDITMAGSAVKIVLVATDPEAVKRAEEDRRLASAPAVPGTVVFDAESRIVTQISDDRLNVFYVLNILNTARMPVDIGGPVTLNLPTEARGAGLLAGSTKQATVTNGRVTVTGPFAPGLTPVEIGFELAGDGGTATLHQVWPVALQAVNILVQQTGGLDISSKQITRKQSGATENGAVITATGPALQAGAALDLEISGLPHHPLWPRYLALALSGVIMTVGIWAAVFPASRRRRAA